MRHRPELTVGITSWNSELFLAHCIRSVFAMSAGVDVRIVVADNGSVDASVGIAHELGAEVIAVRCTQGDALNLLIERSDSPYTLLIHADVVLLSPRWFELCRSKLTSTVSLVSPEDIGCGPYSRPFGAGKPESSFMLLQTDAFQKTAILRWRRRFGIPYPTRCLDLYGEHVTHNLPDRLRRKGLSWYAMNVHLSDQVAEPIYEPAFKPGIWTRELGRLRYGLGNFYSVDGTVTHYHNWYDRIDRTVNVNSTRTSAPDGKGFPLAYIKAYTAAFLRDYSAGTVVVPGAVRSERKPVAL